MARLRTASVSVTDVPSTRSSVLFDARAAMATLSR